MAERLGFAHFNETSINSSAISELNGWYATGGHQAELLSNFSANLSPQTVWVSNLPYQTVHQMGQPVIPHLRSKAFFRIDPHTIAEEYGLRSIEKNRLTTELTRVLSKITSQIDIACHQIAPNIVWGRTLKESLAKAFNIQPDEVQTSHRDCVTQILANTQTFSSPLTEKNINDTLCYLTPNRVFFLEKLCQFDLPKGEGRLVERISLDEVFYKLTTPAFLDVVINFDGCNNPNLPAFGINKNTPRHWVSTAEAYFLNEYGANIEVKRALVFSDSLRIPMIKELKRNPFVTNSYAYGIIAENYLAAFLNNNSRMRGSYLRSLERMLSFQFAQHLDRHGFSVKSYGYGKVFVYYDKDRHDELINLSALMDFSMVTIDSRFFENSVRVDEVML